MNIQCVIALGIVAVFGAAAYAQSPSSGTASSSASGSSSAPITTTTDTTNTGLFDQLDKDKDGTISRKEAAANPKLAKKFNQLDINKDGKLDQSEFARFEAEEGRNSTGSSATSPSGSPGDTSSKPKSTDKPKF